MKKNILLPAFILHSLFAVAQRYEWLSYSSQAASNNFAPVAVGPIGDVYTLIGATTGAVIQGDTIPCLTPGNGVVIARFSATGTFLWGSMVNTDNGVIYGEKIAVDNAGAVYASVNFPNGGSAHLTDTVFPIPGGAATVIIKLDTSGHFVRARTFTSNSPPRISCLATDLYISYEGTIEKLDSALNTVWNITEPTGALEFGYAGFSRADIFVQQNGELIASAFEGYNTTGAIPFGNDSVHFISGGFDEIAVVKLDTSGQVLWTKALQLTAGGQPDIKAVCLDHHGNAYLGAYSINTQNIFANDTLINNIGTGPYAAILKWDAAGIPVRGIGLYPFSSTPTLYDFAVNAQDELLVSGGAGSSNISINGDTVFPAYNNLYLFKFDSSGAFAWWKDAYNSASGSIADGIDVRNGNEYLLSGYFFGAGTAQFGCLSMNAGPSSNFVTFISEQQEIYPSASFTYSITNDTTYTFTDASQNGTSWHWDFGDGDTSNLQNPSHDFAIGGNFTVVLTTYHGACSSTDTLQVVGVGIDEINNSPFFTISPNPSTGDFTINFRNINEMVTIEIYSVLGKLIFNETVYPASKTEINLKNNAPGIYFVKVIDGEKFHCKKVIIERD